VLKLAVADGAQTRARTNRKTQTDRQRDRGGGGWYMDCRTVSCRVECLRVSSRVDSPWEVVNPA